LFLPVTLWIFYVSHLRPAFIDQDQKSTAGGAALDQSQAIRQGATERRNCGSNESGRSVVASMSERNRLEFQPQHTTLEGAAMDWKKTLMIGSFAAGAILFLTGRRPAGLAVAGIGVATFAAEHPEKFEELWHRMPEYIEKGSKFVDMASTFLERMGQEKGGYRNMPVAGGNRF
jgi:hypothetical protein